MAGEEVEPRTPARPQDGGAAAPASAPGRARRRPSPTLLAAALALLAAVAFMAVRQLAAPGGSLGRLVGLGSSCGNGQVESGEECDDGNDRSDDGCLPD